MSDSWPTAIIAVFSFLTLALGTWNTWRQSKMEHKVETVEKKVDVVHALGNSGMAAILRTSQTSADALYAAKPTEENKRLAEDAAKAVKEHMTAQIKADALPKP